MRRLKNNLLRDATKYPEWRLRSMTIFRSAYATAFPVIQHRFYSYNIFYRAQIIENSPHNTWLAHNFFGGIFSIDLFRSDIFSSLFFAWVFFPWVPRFQSHIWNLKVYYFNKKDLNMKNTTKFHYSLIDLIISSRGRNFRSYVSSIIRLNLSSAYKYCIS